MRVRRTLITGSAGFIGRWIQRTIAADDDCTLIDIEQGRDAIDFFRCADGVRYDRVFHCAALVGGRETIDGNPLGVAANLALDSLAFRWAIQHRPKQFVYFSSSAAYPVELQRRSDPVSQLAEWMIDLEHPSKPDATYGLTKLTGEMLAQEALAEGLRTYVFRPFSGYGPDQALSYPFPTFVDRAVRRVDPFMVWGDGTQSRDFIHVADIMAAVELALERDFRGPVNLCTGERTTFLDLAAMCLREAGSNASVEVRRDKPTGVYQRVGDPTNLHEFYTPKITVEQGVAEAVALAR